MIPTPLDCMCPLLKPCDKTVHEFFGSAVLLQVGDSPFVVTAAHVIDEAATSAIYIPGSGRLIELKGRGKKISTPLSGNRDDDKNDMAFVLLEYGCALEVRRLFGFLPIQSVDPSDEAVDGKAYLFCGFPWRKQRLSNKTRQIVADPCSYRGHVTRRSSFGTMGFNEDTHILVHCDRRKQTDERGRRTTLVKPSGMSGGPVWAQTLPDASGVAKWRLVGIAMSYHESQHLLVGVRIAGVLEGIRAAYPHLSDFIPESSTLRTINTQSLRE